MVDNNSITEWILTAVMGLLSLLGLGKLVELLFGRYLKKKDEKEQAEIATEGKKIEADVTLVQTLIKRVETLEKNQTELQKTLMSLTTKNAEFKIENQNLRRENVAQKKKIEEQEKKIQGLELTIRALQSKFDVIARQLSAIDPNGSSKILAEAEQAEKIALRSMSQWQPRESVPVLVIDDNHDTRLMLQELLKLEGIASAGFADGTEALKWLDENEARVIILDLALPTIDGLALAGHIRTNEARFTNRPPADIAFYTGQTVNDIVLGFKERHNVREVFVKARDEPAAVVGTVKTWLESGEA